MTVHNGGSGGGDADHSSIVVLRCRHLSHKYFLMSQFVKTIIFKQIQGSLTMLCFQHHWLYLLFYSPISYFRILCCFAFHICKSILYFPVAVWKLICGLTMNISSDSVISCCCSCWQPQTATSWGKLLWKILNQYLCFMYICICTAHTYT